MRQGRSGRDEGEKAGELRRTPSRATETCAARISARSEAAGGRAGVPHPCLTALVPASLPASLRLPHRHVEPPLVVLVIERHQRHEGLVERLVLLRFEERIERRGTRVVPDQLAVSGGRLGRMALKVAQAVVDLVADQSAEDRTARARGRAEDREAFLA